MPTDAELLQAYQEKVEQEKRLSEGRTCQQFLESPAYVLVDQMMEALEAEALENLKRYEGADREELFNLTVRWQERKKFRARINEQIELAIAEAKLLIESGVDADEQQLRSEVNG